MIQEFDFDLPYIEDEENIAKIIKELGCERQDATQLDAKQNWQRKMFLFGVHGRCIAAMFVRLMGKVTSKGCHKILIECVPQITDTRIINYSGVFALQVEFDYDAFAVLDPLDQKKAYLEVLMTGLKHFCEERELDYNQFLDVAKQIEELNYVNQWIWKKIKSPNKQYTASIMVTHEMEEITFTVIFHNKAGEEIKSEIILTEEPDEYMFVQHMGEFKWLSDNVVVLNSQDKTKQWSARL